MRDKIKHNAYVPLYDANRYKASSTLKEGNGMCQNKAILLVALARAAGIPGRLGFVDVEDYQLSESFKQMIGGVNTMPFHGIAELYIDGKWIHASPAYDLATCQKKGFIPVEFDGVNAAKDSEYTKNGQLHMKHIQYHGPYEDLPLNEIHEKPGPVGVILRYPYFEQPDLSASHEVVRHWRSPLPAVLIEDGHIPSWPDAELAENIHRPIL